MKKNKKKMWQMNSPFLFYVNINIKAVPISGLIKEF